MGESFLPYGRQCIEADDLAAVAEALQSDYLTTGPKVAEFEEAFARKVGARYAVVSANGTTALHLAAMALGLKPGDVAVVPTLTFLSTANAPRFCGADVAFADCDPSTALISPAMLESALDRAGQSVRGIFVVHMNGQSCDMEAIGAIAKRRGIPVVEDGCHAVGTRYKSQDGTWHATGACAHSDLTCFSLHPLKTLTMGEGGVTTTNDPVKYELMTRMRTHGMVRDPARFRNRDLGIDRDGEPNPWYYEMPEIGYNFRATDVQCALGLSQLAKLDRFAKRRAEITARYDAAFQGKSAVVRPFGRVPWCDPVLHLYVLHIDYAAIGKSRGRVMRELKTHGVGTQVHYLPVHRQPYYAGLYGVASMPGADSYYAGCISIPLYPGMSDADADRVVAAVRTVTGLPT